MQLLVIQSHAPYGDLSAKEGLDVALVGAALDQAVTLLFIDDGIYQLLARQQDDEHSEQASAAAPISALHLYEIKRLCVCAESLASRGLEEATVAASCGELVADFLNPAQIQMLIAEHDYTFNF